MTSSVEWPEGMLDQADSSVAVAVISALQVPPSAMFMSELVVRTGSQTEVLERICDALSGTRLVVVSNVSPDEHVTGDLRVVALIDPCEAEGAGVAGAKARTRARLVWESWARNLMANHRCG